MRHDYATSQNGGDDVERNNTVRKLIDTKNDLAFLMKERERILKKYNRRLPAMVLGRFTALNRAIGTTLKEIQYLENRLAVT